MIGHQPATGVSKPRVPLLIMGSPRSGTTFLAQMVNRFFDVHICRDNGTMLRFHRLLPRYEPLTDDGNLRRLIDHLYRDYYFTERLRHRGFTLSERELFERIRQRSFAGLIDAVFSATAASHGRSHWGYKRASFAREDGDHIDELFPGARLVHIIRDARDVVLSMRQATDSLLERSWHFGAVDWVSHVQTGRRIGRRLGPDRYLEVRYERLMADPAAVLTEILEFWGGDPNPDERVARIRAEIGALVKSGNTDKWRRLVPPSAVRTIERVAGPLLQELGYLVVNPDIAGRSIGAPEMVWLQVDRVCRILLHTRPGALVRYRVEAVKRFHRVAFLHAARGTRGTRNT